MGKQECIYCASCNLVSYGKRRGRFYWFCNSCKECFSTEIKEELEPLPFPEEEKTPSQDWTAYNSAKTKEKILFLEIVNELLNQIDFKQENGVGRPRADLREILFCCAVKTYAGISSRRVISDIQLSNQKGYIKKIWHFNSIMRAFSNKETTPILKRLILLSALPLKELETQFAVDSSGFSTSEFGRWADYRYGDNKKYRKWRKAHIICGTKTNVITDAKITHGTAADCPQLAGLVLRTSAHFNVKEVSGDKAYLSNKNMDVIASVGATPYIMFKENSYGKGSQVWKRMYLMFCLEPDKYAKHYHRRSNVESCFFMIKKRFGASVSTRSPIGHENEILFRIFAHNILCLIQEFYESGISAPKLNCYV